MLLHLTCLAAAATAIAADTASDKIGVVEMDLVFPRNDTYAPTPFFPIVFAFQNPALAAVIKPHVHFTVWDRNNMSKTVSTGIYDLKWANFSTNGNIPYLEHSGYSAFNIEGHWRITWRFGWTSCVEDPLNLDNNPNISYQYPTVIYNSTGGSVAFTTKYSAQEVDLVAATNNKETCLEDLGVAINVTKILEPMEVKNPGGETCVVVASSNPTPDPCRVKIDASAASNISSSIAGKICKNIVLMKKLGRDIPPGNISCPEDDENSGGASQRFMVGGIVGLAATLGTLGYLLL